jgi:hypothetical protein
MRESPSSQGEKGSLLLDQKWKTLLCSFISKKHSHYVRKVLS